MHASPALLMLALVAVSVPACADDGNDRPAAGTVTVTITGIADSIGDDVAVVMFDGLGMGNPDTRGIGGFGVQVDADPFSTTQTIATPASIDIATPFPYVTREPLVVEPGEYTIMVWIAEGLSLYSRWVPADGPGLGGCQMDVDVEAGQPTMVTVDSIPPWTGVGVECNAPAPSDPDEFGLPETGVWQSASMASSASSAQHSRASACHSNGRRGAPSCSGRCDGCV